MGKSTWTKDQWQLALEMRKANCTYASIAKMLRKTVSAVENRFIEYHNYNIKGEKERYADPTGYIINANIHQDKGRVNPFALARAVMYKRFSTNNVGEHFDGRLIKGMQDWDNIIMPELNRHLLSKGQAQIDYNPIWVQK